jgi:cytochrome b561
MSLDGPKSYSATAKWLHWLVAALVIALVPIGMIMADLEPGPLQDRLFVLHESLGITLLALMVVRLANRLRGAPAPDASLGRAERIAAGAVHHTLYLMLFLTPLVGWLALSAYGFGPSFFGLGNLPALLAKDEPLSKILFGLHEAGGLLIVTLVLAHVAGALRHVLLKRDDLITRMLPASWRGYRPAP